MGFVPWTWTRGRCCKLWVINSLIASKSPSQGARAGWGECCLSKLGLHGSSLAAHRAHTACGRPPGARGVPGSAPAAQPSPHPAHLRLCHAGATAHFPGRGAEVSPDLFITKTPIKTPLKWQRTEQRWDVPPPCRDTTSGCLFCSVLSQCIHAVAALLYPFTWAHTYIPVVPECLLDTVCCPTPFMVGIQMRHLEQVLEQPMEEVLLPQGRGGSCMGPRVNLCPRVWLGPGGWRL